MENRPDFFPRFRTVSLRKSNDIFTRVTYTPGSYYCEKWEYLLPETALVQQEHLEASKVSSIRGEKNQKTEWLVDLFFLISVGLFVLTFLWAQGLLS